jgi:hypothetical protein
VWKEADGKRGRGRWKEAQMKERRLVASVAE